MERKLIILIAGIIFFLLPWYYTDSGQPQPVDVFIFMLLTFFFFLRFPYIKEYFNHSQPLRVFFVLSLYTAITLLTNYIIMSREISLILAIQNLYFVFLVILFLCLIVYLKRKSDIETYYILVLRFLALATIIPLIFLLKNGASFMARTELSFNNANQLGFFALVNMSIFFYTNLIIREQDIPSKKLLSLFIININLLFMILSASRACYPTVLIYILSYPLLFKIKLHKFAIPLFRILGGLLFIVCLLFFSYKLYLVTINTRSSDYISVTSDFYIRALQGITSNVDNIWFFLFGNGTYNVAGRTLEFHNNFLATFNRGGLIGLILFTYFNFILVKELLKKGFYYFIPYFCYLIYSMLHYSYRTRVNWIMLVMVMFILFEGSRSPIRRHLVKDAV